MKNVCMTLDRKMQQGLQGLPSSIAKTIHLKEDLEKIINDVQEDTENVARSSKNENTQAIMTELCCICNKETSGMHKCTKCQRFVHTVICGETVEEGFGGSALYSMCINQKKIPDNQEKAYQSLQTQAIKIVQLSNKRFPTLETFTSIKIQIPSVDRCKGDQKNIVEVVMERTVDDLYKIGTKERVLATLYSRNQIHPCKHKFIDVEDVKYDPIAVRTVNKNQSRFGGHGFIRCSCNSTCSSKRCCCKKNNLQCNPKCHGDNKICKNK